MKRLTVMIERDEDALAIVQLLMQGADKAVDFRLETINDDPTPHKRRATHPRHLENSGQARCWDEVKNFATSFTVKDVEPLCVKHGLAQKGASSMLSAWVAEGLVARTGNFDGRRPIYLIKR